MKKILLRALVVFITLFLLFLFFFLYLDYC